jgi:hypothetical protein
MGLSRRWRRQLQIWGIEWIEMGVGGYRCGQGAEQPEQNLNIASCVIEV